jgi:hypothetical protein
VTPGLDSFARRCIGRQRGQARKGRKGRCNDTTGGLEAVGVAGRLGDAQ